MKKISFRFIFAALAATAALAGCTKEISTEKAIINPASAQAEGTRVIAVSFAPQTKTYLDKDGLQPRFADGDSILISNGNALDTCEVKDETISTNLLGPLKAVYPYKAAKMNDKNQIDTVFVSSEQDGTFASANICMARMTDENEESLFFENKTAVLRFYVGNEIGVTSVSVKSESEKFSPTIGTEITVTAPSGKTLYDQMPENQDRRVCYVAVPYGMHEQLTITTTANTQTPELKQLTDVTFDTNNIYTVFIPYYIQVGDQKWAYCNIGAFLPEEPGLYFAWGETQGHWLNAKSDDHSFTKDTYDHQAAAIDADIKLDSGHDAARENWGEKWRMPMFEEYSLLATTDFEWSAISGKWGMNYTQDGKSLYFPPTGYIEGSSRKNPKVLYYLSSTINTDNKDSVYVWCSDESALISRYHGIPIRPIYGPAPHESDDDSDLLSGKFSVGNKTIMFSKGNLYWDGSSYQFESNQYDYRQFNGIPGDTAVISGISVTTPENTVGTFWWVPSYGIEEGKYPFSQIPSQTLGNSANDIFFTNAEKVTANPDFVVNGKSGKYRTFSEGELNYILNERPYECRFAKARVNGVQGLLIFPDDYILPSGYEAYGGTRNGGC